MLHQQSERRGSLVSRVTSDVDQITQFLQWGGVILLISVGQIVVTTIVMAVYSWQLTLVVLVAFAAGVRGDPGVPAAARGRVRPGPQAHRRDARRGRPRASSARRSSGRTASPGAPRRGSTTRSTQHRLAQQRALRTSVTSFSTGELAAGLALAAVVVVGVLLGVGGDLTRRAADRVPVPGDAVHPAGADRHRGAQRGAERDRRLAAGARRARRRARRGRPRRAGRRPAARADRRAVRPTSTSPTRAARRCSPTST